MKASWPSHAADAVDSSAISQFESLKELVKGVRNARTEYGLEQARKVSKALTVNHVHHVPIQRSGEGARKPAPCPASNFSRI